MKHQTNNCYENPMDHVDDIEYLEKIQSKVNNYVNPHVICRARYTSHGPRVGLLNLQLAWVKTKHFPNLFTQSTWLAGYTY